MEKAQISKNTKFHPISCPFCSSYYLGKRELRKHILQVHHNHESVKVITSESIDDANDDDLEYREERSVEKIKSPKKPRSRVRMSEHQKSILEKEMDKYLAGKIDKVAMLNLTAQTGLKAKQIKVRSIFEI